MRIGLLMSMIEGLHPSQLFSFVQISSLGGLESNRLLQAPVRRLSTEVWLKLLLNYPGSVPFLQSCMFRFLLLFCCVIIRVQSPLFSFPQPYQAYGDWCFFFVRDKVMTKQLKICHILALDQWADVLTKPLSSTQLYYVPNSMSRVSLLITIHLEFKGGLLVYTVNSWFVSNS